MAGTVSDKADAAWRAFTERLDDAELEFAQGRPDDFKALWSHADDVTISGAFGGTIEHGWDAVARRLDWASSKYADGKRTRDEVSGAVADGFAYLVQRETIDFRVAGSDRRARQELRVTMVFRREASGWRIAHRHADAQTTAETPG